MSGAKTYANWNRIFMHLYSNRYRSYTKMELSKDLKITYSSVQRAVQSLSKIGCIRVEGKKVAWFERRRHYTEAEQKVFLMHSQELLLTNRSWEPKMGNLEKVGNWEYVVSHLNSDEEFRKLNKIWTKTKRELNLHKGNLYRTIAREARRIGLKSVESIEELESRGAVLVRGVLSVLTRYLNLFAHLEPGEEDRTLPPLEYSVREITRGEALLRRLLPLPPPNRPPKIGRRRLTEIRWDEELIGYLEFVSPEKVRKLINRVSQFQQVSRMLDLEKKLKEITNQINERLKWFAKKVKHGEPLPGYCKLCPQVELFPKAADATNQRLA